MAKPSPPLRALTLAAMALPGMACAVEFEDVQFQYSHYEEGGRNNWTGPNGTVKELAPLEVNSVGLGFGLRLTDRMKLLFNFIQDTWSGATPVLSAPQGFLTVSGASAYPASDSRVNKELVPYGVGPNGQRTPQPQLWNVMTSASAETRRQFDFNLNQDWDRFGLNVGGGLSEEPDFNSRFVHVNGRWDLNQKLTTLNAGISYTSSDIDANLGPPTDWIDYGLYRNATTGPRIVTEVVGGQTVQKFVGDRQDWSVNVGLTQVLDRNSTFAFGLTYARSTGFLENPYKLALLAFADPNTPPVLFNGLLLTRLYSVAESRPDARNQLTLNANLSHYFAGADAALHLNYAYSRDDWGIQSHTAEIDWAQAFGRGWLVTPRVRYYTQTAADFFQPYFIWEQRAPVNAAGTLDFSGVPAQYYSSDYRLGGFGAASAGLSVRKQFGRGVSFEAGMEYYVHSGQLKFGGGGEGSYADFNYWMFNAALIIDLSASSTPDYGDQMDHKDHAAHAEHGSHAGALAPAGVMYAHMIGKAEDFMVSYQSMWSNQSGPVLSGSKSATDAAIVSNGCGSIPCSMAPQDMSTHMHMLDSMYAPTDSVNLMLTLQFMDMDMTMTALEGSISGGGGAHDHGGHTSETTAGVGDTWISALFRLLDRPEHEVHLGLALSIPTGAVDKKMSDGQFMEYGMQLGSGTWDVQPSVTYNGLRERWFWGAQVSATIRTQSVNNSGYSLGNVFQATGWTGFRFAEWLSGTVRGVYTTQGTINGQFNGPSMQMSPADFPQNYGGRFWDVGLGLECNAPWSRAGQQRQAGMAAAGERRCQWLSAATLRQLMVEFEPDVLSRRHTNRND